MIHRLLAALQRVAGNASTCASAAPQTAKRKEYDPGDKRNAQAQADPRATQRGGYTGPHVHDRRCRGAAGAGEVQVS